MVNMPYILKADRPQYDSIIWRLIKAIDVSAYSAIGMLRKRLINILNSQDVTNVDGHMNYFITKLLKEMRWTEEKTLEKFLNIRESTQYREVFDFLFNIFLEVYPPKYFNYNRLEGMLGCCHKEFNRRYGYKALNACALLSELSRKFYDNLTAPYEDKKIELNGDV